MAEDTLGIKRSKSRDGILRRMSDEYAMSVAFFSSDIYSYGAWKCSINPPAPDPQPPVALPPMFRKIHVET